MFITPKRPRGFPGWNRNSIGSLELISGTLEQGHVLTPSLSTVIMFGMERKMPQEGFQKSLRLRRLAARMPRSQMNIGLKGFMKLTQT
jgi:hypothetical protein